MQAVASLVVLTFAAASLVRNRLPFGLVCRGNDTPAATDAKSLRAKRMNLVTEARKLNDKAEAEGRDFTAEEKTQWDRYNAEIDTLGARIERAEKLEEIERRNAAIANDPTTMRNRAPGSGVADPEEPERKNSDAPIPQNEATALALQGWMRSNSRNARVRKSVTDRHRQAARQCRIDLGRGGEIRLALMSSMELDALRSNVRFAWDGKRYNALSSMTGTTGSVLIPDGFITRFERAMLAYGGILQVAEIIRTPTGNDMMWPMGDDTSNTGELLGESASVVTEANPSFTGMRLSAYKFSSKMVKVPFELMQDSAFGLEALLGDMLGERLGRIQNTYGTTGTGANQPKGVTVAAPTGVTTATATAIKWDELIQLEESVDMAYRNSNCGFMANDSTYQYLRRLKDAQGKYLWMASPNAGVPDSLLNYSIYRNQSMQATSSGAPVAATVSMLFGQLSAIKVRQVGGIRLRRLSERYADNDQEAFIAFQRSDSNLLDAGGHPVKALLQHS